MGVPIEVTMTAEDADLNDLWDLVGLLRRAGWGNFADALQTALLEMA